MLRIAAAVTLVAAFLGVPPAAISAANGPVILAIIHSAQPYRTYQRIQLQVNLRAQYSNPFDPAQIDLHADFIGPGGRRERVNGFYYQGYRRVPHSIPWVLKPSGSPEWLIRFAAPVPGVWTYVVYLRDRTGVQVHSTLGSPLRVQAGTNPGYVRVSRYDHHYLAFDNGTSYYPVGENLAFWRQIYGLNEYYNWLNAPGKLHAQRANLIRVWMDPWTFQTDFVRPLGNYRASQANAWAFDQLLTWLEADRIEVIPVLLEDFEFRHKHSSDVWRDNPYNRRLGGPAETPCDFFSNPTAIALFERNLRYDVARWGYSTAILGWELWNEVDLVTNFNSCRPQVLSWHSAMITALRSLDPVHHLVSTTLARAFTDPSIWRLPGISFVQGDHYDKHLPRFIVGDIHGLRRYGKPVWMSEYGPFGHPPGPHDDHTGQFIHLGQWASLLSGAAGAGLNWNWQAYVDRYHTYWVYGAIPRFIAGIAMDREHFSPRWPIWLRVRGGRIEVFVLQGRTVSLLWARCFASAGCGSFTLPLSAVGRATRVQWWNTRLGTPISGAPIHAVAGSATLVYPGHAGDYAAKLFP